MDGKQLFVAFILMITLGGCGVPNGSNGTGRPEPATATPLQPDGSGETPSSIDPALQDTRWTLVEIHGVPPLAGSDITLDFENGQTGGYSGCNWYGGPYQVAEKGRLSITELAGTTRGCLDQGVQQQETAFLQALQQATRYHVRDERLELMDAHGEIILIFSLRPPQAMNPDDLVGMECVNRATSLGGASSEDCRAENCPF